MKKLKALFSLILIFSFLVSLSSCYIISAQSMNKLTGTYKLTTYTYTPTYEHKDGVTPKTYDYINDEEYKYEDYLIITGTGTGYYVHKEAGGDNYVKEITLAYEYNQENPSKVEYVIYNDSISKNSDEGGTHRLGVSKKTLNYNKSGFDFTQLITKKKMHSESISVKWEKVDKATDLSFATSKLSNIKHYKYEAFAARGIYEINTYVNSETHLHSSPYQYFFIVIDTADGVTEASIYYATAEAPTEKVKRTVSFSANEDFTALTIDGALWSVDTQLGSSYYNSTDGIYTMSIRQISNNTSKNNIDYYISSRLPAAE